MNELYKELSQKSDTVLRTEYEKGNYALITFKNMLSNGYLTQDRYNRIIRADDI